MADKQPQLNGAYYGPAIPPPQPPGHHSNRGRRCCCCLFSFCWKLIVAIVVFIVLIYLIFWAVVQPRGFRFHVTDAKLTQFNYTGNTLNYNLVLNFTARNPNKKLSIYYDRVEGHVSYDGIRFASADVITWQNSFLQYTKSTDRMSGAFVGQHVMVLDQVQKSDFEEDGRNRVFNIDVRLNFQYRFKLGDVTSYGSQAKAKCELEVPLSSKGTTAVSTVFQPTRCHVSL